MRMLSFLLKKRTQKEFALVELVIVIAVFAIPVAIAIPVVFTILTDARSIYEQDGICQGYLPLTRAYKNTTN